MENNTKPPKEKIKAAYSTLETLADDINIIHYELFCQQPEKDYDSGAVVNIVSRNDMPYNVRAFCIPHQNTMTLPNDVHQGTSEYIFLSAHESAHLTYGTTNEYTTDCLAAAKTGHYEFVRNGINEHVKL